MNETTREERVTIERSVRFGRLIIGGGVIGAVVLMLVSAVFPVLPEAEYTLGQVVGLMALYGAVAGMLLGALLALLLAAVSRRSRGEAVVQHDTVGSKPEAQAKQSDTATENSDIG